MIRKTHWSLIATLVATGCGAPTQAPTGRSTHPETAESHPSYTAYVRGPLAKADLAAARADHDQLAGGSQAAAHAAGDLGHHVMLGTGEPAGDNKDEFLALDEWIDLAGPQAVYGDPKFQAGFGALFAKPVAPELYRRRPDWVTWGDLKPPTGGGPYWVMSEGSPGQAERSRQQSGPRRGGWWLRARRACGWRHRTRPAPRCRRSARVLQRRCIDQPRRHARHHSKPRLSEGVRCAVRRATRGADLPLDRMEAVVRSWR